MGTIRNGANGGFSGKAGSIIGSSWRDINYIKGLPKRSKKPKTEKQLGQQSRFRMAIRFLLPVKDYINVGFNDLKQGRRTGFNVAITKLLERAMTGLVIDYSLVEFARGPISVPAAVVVSPETGKLVISWAIDVLKASGNSDDELIVLVYEAGSNDYVVGPPSALRSAGTVDVVMPSDWSGLSVHVYVYFISKNKDRVSNSIYAGNATLI